MFKPTKSEDHKGWYESGTYPYFLVHPLGKVMNKKTGYETYGARDDRGYMKACIYDSKTDTKKEVKVHRVVCDAMHGPCPEGHEVGHMDDVRHNNASSNVYYTTRSANMKKMHAKRKREKK